MMPVVAGEKSTRRQIFGYSVVLLAVSVLPWVIGGTGAIYGIAALVLSGIFLGFAVPVAFRTAVPDDAMKPEKRLFAWSVIYLFVLCAALVADRMLLA
jgi:protoheme IX farnesyltransferase